MKKTLAVLIILLMTAALVFAGGSQGGASSGGATKITVQVYDRGTDGGRTSPTDNVWTKWIHDKVLKDLNIDVTFQAVGRWSEGQDMTNLLASNSAPDLCYTYNQPMITQFDAMGGIFDLLPHVDKYLPDMKKLLGADPALPDDLIYRDKDPATGRLPSVTNYVTNVARRATYIRKDWLDKLGLPIPKTTKEFHDALVAFKNRDPGGVGATRIVPFGLMGNEDPRWSLANLNWSFVDPKISEKDKWILAGWDWERAIAVPGYKEGVRTWNAWYNEGLLFHDFPLMRVADDFNNMLKSGVVGAFSQNWDLPYRTDYGINVELAKNVPGAEFVPCDPFQSSDGITHNNISDKPGMRIFIPAASKNPIAALQYLNWLCKYENFHYIQVGDPGVNHMIYNGVPQVIPRNPPDQWIQNSPNNIDYTMPINGIEMGNTDMNARVLALSYVGISSEKIVNAYNLATANGRAPPVFQATSQKRGVYGQTLRDKTDALLAQAVTAPVANFDRVWDAGYADWLASGGQEMLDEYRALAATNPAWK